MIAEDTRQVEKAHPDFFGVQLDPNGLCLASGSRCNILQFIMVMMPDESLICYLCKNKTCIIIPSEPHPGTQKILENCQTIKTQEQAF